MAVCVCVNENVAPFKEYVGLFNYPVEEHKITTKDGYILTYFRIQAKGQTEF